MLIERFETCLTRDGLAALLAVESIAVERGVSGRAVGGHR